MAPRSVNLYLRLAAAASCQIAVQFTYALSFSLITPLFVTNFKIKEWVVTLITAFIGPGIGFVVQPIMGAIGDRCTFKFGRRRIFIFVGCIINIIGTIMLCICTVTDSAINSSFSHSASSQFITASSDSRNPNPSETSGTFGEDHAIGITLGVIGLFISYFGLNIMQAPARAIVSDLFDDENQQDANLMINAFNGGAAVICNLITGIITSESVRRMENGEPGIDNNTKYIIMFAVSSVLSFIFVLPTIIFAREQRYVPQDGIKISVTQPFVDLWHTIKMIDRNIFFIILSLFLGWFAYKPFTNHFTGFVSANVYPEELEDTGLAMSCYMLAVLYFIQFISIVFFPFITYAIGEIQTFILSQGLSIISYLVYTITFFYFPKNEQLDSSNSEYVVWVLVMFAAVIYPGMAFTQTNSLPYSMLKRAVPGERYGAFVGLLNCAVVVGQFVALMIIMVLQLMMEGMENADESKFLVSIILSLIGAVICTALSFVLFKVKNTPIDEVEMQTLMGKQEKDGENKLMEKHLEIEGNETMVKYDDFDEKSSSESSDSSSSSSSDNDRKEMEKESNDRKENINGNNDETNNGNDENNESQYVFGDDGQIEL